MQVSLMLALFSVVTLGLLGIGVASAADDAAVTTATESAVVPEPAVHMVTAGVAPTVVVADESEPALPWAVSDPTMMFATGATLLALAAGVRRQSS